MWPFKKKDKQSVETLDMWKKLDALQYKPKCPRQECLCYDCGKYLKEKLSQITIEFKCPPHLLFPSQQGEMTPNMLVLYLQPDEGIHWRFEAKVPDTVEELRSVDMEFHYDEAFGKTTLPDAYERLLLDTMMGDASLFTRADEVETAWGIINPIIAAWETQKQPPAIYKPGTWGPRESDELLARDEQAWSMWDGRIQ